MKPRSFYRLGVLQLRILKIVWDLGEATVGDVLAGLGGRPGFAYTTVATMLRKMEARGLLEHRIEGRSFVYRATVGEEAVSRNMAEDLLDRLFEGSLSDMVSHLLTHRQVSREELARIEQMIAAQKRRK